MPRAVGCALVLAALLLIATTLNAGPLHDAVQKGDLQRVIELLESGADIDELDEEMRTPLNIAFEFGHPEIIEELGQRGADFFALPLGPPAYQIQGEYFTGWRGRKSVAFVPPVAGLFIDLLKFIFMRLDPKGRSRLRQVCQGFRDIVDCMRRPKSKGGMGLTDTLPITTICIDATLPRQLPLRSPNPRPRIAQVGSFIYAVDRINEKLVVIDAKDNRAVQSSHIPGLISLESIGESLFIFVNTQAFLVDLQTLTPTREISHEESTELRRRDVLEAIPVGKYVCGTLYCSNLLEFREPHPVTFYGGSVVKHLAVERPDFLKTIGNFLFVASTLIGKLTVVEIDTFSIVAKIDVEPGRDDFGNVCFDEWLFLGRFLYWSAKGSVLAVDLGGYF